MNGSLSLSLFEQVSAKKPPVLLGSSRTPLFHLFFTIPQPKSLEPSQPTGEKQDGDAGSLPHLAEEAEGDVQGEKSGASVSTGDEEEQSEKLPVIQLNEEVNRTIALQYVNPKLIPNNEEASVDVTLSFTEPLLTATDIKQGNFIQVIPEDFEGLPEEWSTKDGVEKDLNSNLYGYNLHVYLPRPVNSTVPDQPYILERGILTDPSKLPKSGSTASIASRPGKASQASLMDIAPPQPLPGLGNTALPKTLSAQSNFGLDTIVGRSVAQKSLRWRQPLRVWATKDQIDRWRAQIQKKQTLAVELHRVLLPQFSHLEHTAPKARGKLKVDWTRWIFPKITEISGVYPLESFDILPPGSVPSDSPLATLTASNATPNTQPADAASVASQSAKNARAVRPADLMPLKPKLELTLQAAVPIAPEIERQSLNKSVFDYIPRRVESIERRTRAVHADLKQKIKAVVEDLVKSVADQEQKHHAQVHTDGQSHTVDGYIMRLKHSGRYDAWKNTLSRSIAQVIKEVGSLLYRLW